VEPQITVGLLTDQWLGVFDAQPPSGPPRPASAWTRSHAYAASEQSATWLRCGDQVLAGFDNHGGRTSMHSGAQIASFELKGDPAG
jgi:hypothetical protein